MKEQHSDLLMEPKSPKLRKRFKQQSVIETILPIVQFYKALYIVEWFMKLTLSQAMNVRNKYNFELLEELQAKLRALPLDILMLLIFTMLYYKYYNTTL